MYAEPKVQALSAIASAAIVAGLALALILGLRVTHIVEQAQNLASVVFSPEPPPPPPEEKQRPLSRKETAAAKGDPAPRNLKKRATRIVAPPMPVILKPSPVVTAPVADLGDAASTGASDLPGPGPGAGGIGSGFGGGGQGGFGNGRGGGRREPPVQGPRQIRGKLAYSDIPEAMLPEGHGAVGVAVIVAVNPDGYVGECEIDRPSGYRAVDDLVCRLIRQRYVYRPALDRFGRPVRARVLETATFFGHPEGR